MLHSLPSEPSAAPAADRPARADENDLSVEPVAARPGGEPRITELPPARRLERLHRLALEARVATLERQLERARQRRQRLVEHYEAVIQGPNGDDTEPVFSWRGCR